MKYVLAPSVSVGNYWANKMELKRNEYKVILRAEQLRGLTLKLSNIIIVEEEPFGYPPMNSNFDKLMDLYENVYKPKFINDI